MRRMHIQVGLGLGVGCWGVGVGVGVGVGDFVSASGWLASGSGDWSDVGLKLGVLNVNPLPNWT